MRRQLRWAGIERQFWRDAVLRIDAEGLAGLADSPYSAGSST